MLIFPFKIKINIVAFRKIATISFVEIENSVLQKKSLARFIACQVLSMYYDPSNEDKNVESLLNMVNDYYIKEIFLVENNKNRFANLYRSKFVSDLINGVLSNVEELDSIIIKFLRESSPIDAIDSTVLQSFRLATFELKNSVLAKNIIINEYVDIVAEFCDKTQVAFANGVLNGLGRELRKD
ncbi:N utilization substance protein B [Bacilli bacterium]|nr:N utilization substance protein B [Bacilli bacterium]